MPAWIECRECGIEFRDKPGRTKCPECGTRIADERDDEDEWDDERPRRKSKGAAGKGNGVMYALIGVGVLAVGLVVVLILLLGGGVKRDPSKVTVANFQQLNLGMTQKDAEKILAGSSSSSAGELQTEMSNAFGMQGWMTGVFAQFSGGGGTWRRWDGPNSDLRVWALFAEPLLGGNGKETLTFCTAIEKLPGGGYRSHQGKSGGLFGGFPFPQGFPNPGGPAFPGGQPFPGGGGQPFPPGFPFPK